MRVGVASGPRHVASDRSIVETGTHFPEGRRSPSSEAGKERLLNASRTTTASPIRSGDVLCFARRGLRLASSISELMREALQILVVEDEKALGKLLALVLGGPASKVTSAADGCQALMRSRRRSSAL